VKYLRDKRVIIEKHTLRGEKSDVFLLVKKKRTQLLKTVKSPAVNVNKNPELSTKKLFLTRIGM
jgi:hypothetical protein